MASGPLRSKLTRESLLSLASGGLYAATQWLVLKLLFLYAGTATAGWYAFAMAIITPAFAFSSFGLRGILATDTKREFGFSAYFSFRLATGLIAAGCALAIYVLLGAYTDVTRDLLIAFVSLAAYRGVEALSEVAQAEYQRRGEMGFVFRAFVLKSTLGIGLFAFVISHSRDVGLGFAIMTGVSLTVLLGYELRTRRLNSRLKLGYDWHSIAAIARLAWPVAVVLLLGSLQGSIPRYFLERETSIEALGVFAGLAYLTVIGGFVSTAVANAMSPILGELCHARRMDSFRALLIKVLCADVFLALVMLLLFHAAGEPILRILFNREVAAHHHLLPLVAAVALALFWDSHLGCALTVLRLLKVAAAIQMMRILMIVPLTAFLVDRWGVAGALCACIALPLCSAPFAAAAILYRAREMKREFAPSYGEPDSRATSRFSSVRG